MYICRLVGYIGRRKHVHVYISYITKPSSLKFKVSSSRQCVTGPLSVIRHTLRTIRHAWCICP